MWASIAVFALLAGVRIYNAANRSQIHSDETYSYMLAKHNEAYTTALPDTVLTGAELRKLPHCNHSYFEDITALYHKNYDPPHASLYYMMLRTALIGVDSYSPAQIIARGVCINMLFWCLSFWLMFLMIRQLGRDRWWIVPMLLLVAFGNPLSIANTLMVREYQLAEMCLIGLTLIVMTISEDISRCGRRSWIILAGCTTLALSTGYLNAYYVALLYTWMFVATIRQRSKVADYLRIIATGIVGIGLCPAIYLGYFDFLLVKNVHTQRAFANFCVSFDLAFYTIFLKSVYTIPGLLTLIIGLVATLASRGNDTSKQTVNLLFVSAFALCAIVMAEYTSVLRETRYAYPFVALSTLWIATLLTRTNRIISLLLGIALSAAILINCLTTSANTDYRWQRMRTQLNDGAIIYKLNNNELSQLSPCVNDTAHYVITTSDSVLSDTCTVVIGHKGLNFEKPRTSASVTGPLFIYKH